MTSNPAPINDNGILNVFVRGGDGGLYDQFYNTSWSGWYNLGGYLTSDPVPLITPNLFGAFVLGGDGGMYLNSWNGSAWNWSALGMP